MLLKDQDGNDDDVTVPNSSENFTDIISKHKDIDLYFRNSAFTNMDKPVEREV